MVVVALFLIAILSAGSAPAARPSNTDCLSCHSDKEISIEVDGQAVSLFVDAAELKASVHSPLQCTDCHAGITAIPHAEKVPPVQCQTCHPAEADAFERSVHGRPGGPEVPCRLCHGSHNIQPAANLGTAPCRLCHEPMVVAYSGSVHGRAVASGIKEAPRCTDCHGPLHTLVPQSDPKSPINRKNMAATCGRCHANATLMQRLQIPIPRAFELYQQSVHSRAVKEGLPAATCNDCHRAHDILIATNPQSSIYRENIPATCGHCHEKESEEYLESIHGTAMQQGAIDSPVCTDCHGEHLIRAPQDPRSPVSVARVSETCARCHGVARVARRYDISTNRVETYFNTYHGLAARGGSTVVANCASCHGDHLILPASDPRSSVNKANLPKTCGKCHPGASADFAKGPVHLSASARRQPVLYYVRKFYLLLILITIAGMSLHNGLDFFRKLRRDYRRSRGADTPRAGEDAERPRHSQGWFPRMSASERWQHGLLAVSFIVLVYTGFALRFPDVWLFRWFTGLEDGYAIRGWTHRGAGVVLVLAGLWHLGYLSTRWGRVYLRTMLPRYRDVKEGIENFLYLAGLRAEGPRFDHFSYVEKVEYWALIWGATLMITTGLMLWFENLTLRFFPLWVVELVTIIHYYEAWLATLAILVWHLYWVIFNPDVYPMNWSWLTGVISEEMLRHDHPGEYERLRAEGQVASAPGAPPLPDEPNGSASPADP